MTSEAVQPHAHTLLPCLEGREGAATHPSRRCLSTGEQGSSLAGCNKALSAPSLNHSSAGSEHSICASDHPVQMISHRSAQPPPAAGAAAAGTLPLTSPSGDWPGTALAGFRTASGHDGSAGSCSCPAPAPSLPAGVGVRGWGGGEGMEAHWGYISQINGALFVGGDSSALLC